MPYIRFVCVCTFVFFAITKHCFAEVLTIATGSMSGLYYPSGGAICRIFNLSANGENKCIVESTPGSEYNLNAIEGGLNNFAFVQADELFTYMQNQKKEEKETEIKVVFPLYTETFVMVASKDSQINSIMDIKGKNINIGIEGSGVRNFTSRIIQFFDMKSTDFKNIATANQASAEHLLCSGALDVALVVSGQPSNILKNLTENCGAKIIPFPQEFINSIIKNNNFYTLTTIPAGMYYEHKNNIQTVGTRAILITSKYTSDEIVYNLVTYIVKNFESFHQYSPVMQKMSVEEIGTAGLSHFPIHPSASKAFKENGLIN